MGSKPGNVTVFAGAIISLIIACFVFIPSETNAEENEAVIRVDYTGPYWGTIKGYWEDGIEAEGNREFTMKGDIIYVIMNKADNSNEEMTVSILVDGEVRVSDSTSEPEGTVRLSMSFGEVLDDDNETDDNGSSNRICSTSMVGFALLLSVGILFISGINRR